jgi:Flp pilus assembly protein TadG
MNNSRRTIVQLAASLAKGWFNGRRGNVALLFAFLTPMAIGGAGIATEVGLWYHRRLELQSAADAAAYAAAVELRAGGTQTTFTAEALAAAQAAGFDPNQGTITVNNPPQSGTHQNNQAIEVLISENVPRFFSSIFVNTPLIEHTRSVTIFQTAAYGCIDALNPTASATVLVSGSANVTTSGCSIMANSMASNAIQAQGSATLSTDCLISVGGVSLTSGVTETVCQAPLTQAPPVADPYGDVTMPTPQSGCQDTTGPTYSPGTYCNGLTLQSAANLQPGTYYIEGGDLKINAGANVIGNGVTIFMQGSNTVDMNGNATVNISAPTDGPYAGMLMIGDRSCTSCGSNTSETLNGTAGSLMTGAIYFPKQNVNYLGNFAGVNGCTQVVADTITWNGHTHLSINCTGTGVKNIQAYEAVRFVE